MDLVESRFFDFNHFLFLIEFNVSGPKFYNPRPIYDSCNQST